MKKLVFKSKGYNLSAIIEYPKVLPAPTIILCHGLTNNKDEDPLIRETAEALVDSGFISFRFDYYGSGESPGEMREKTYSILEANTRDALDFISTNKNITKLGIWGRSTGGTMALLLGTDKRTKATVVVSATVWLNEIWDNWRTKLRQEQLRLQKKGLSLPGTGNYKGDYDFNNGLFDELDDYENRLIKNLSKLSHILVLATTEDEKSPLHNATTIINKAREPKHVHIFENSDHSYKGRKKEAVKLAVDWFKNCLF